MKEPKFTGGEWAVSDKERGVVVTDDVEGSRKALVYFYGGHPICESIANKDDLHLIAASKEIYEALQAVVDQLQAVGAPGSVYNPSLTQARKALEKARGGDNQ